MAAPLASFKELTFGMTHTLIMGMRTSRPVDPANPNGARLPAVTRISLATGIVMDILLESTYDYILKKKGKQNWKDDKYKYKGNGDSDEPEFDDDMMEGYGDEEYDEDVQYNRKRRSIETQDWMFRKMEQQLASLLGVDGNACLLRFICDIKGKSIHEWTLAGQVLDVLFTPSYGPASLLSAYRAASDLGESNASACATEYSKCHFSILDYLPQHTRDSGHNEL